MSLFSTSINLHHDTSGLFRELYELHREHPLANYCFLKEGSGSEARFIAKVEAPFSILSELGGKGGSLVEFSLLGCAAIMEACLKEAGVTIVIRSRGDVEPDETVEGAAGVLGWLLFQIRSEDLEKTRRDVLESVERQKAEIEERQ